MAPRVPSLQREILAVFLMFFVIEVHSESCLQRSLEDVNLEALVMRYVLRYEVAQQDALLRMGVAKEFLASEESVILAATSTTKSIMALMNLKDLVCKPLCTDNPNGDLFHGLIPKNCNNTEETTGNDPNVGGRKSLDEVAGPTGSSGDGSLYRKVSSNPAETTSATVVDYPSNLDNDSISENSTVSESSTKSNYSAAIAAAANALEEEIKNAKSILPKSTFEMMHENRVRSREPIIKNIQNNLPSPKPVYVKPPLKTPDYGGMGGGSVKYGNSQVCAMRRKDVITRTIYLLENAKDFRDVKRDITARQYGKHILVLKEELMPEVDYTDDYFSPGSKGQKPKPSSSYSGVSDTNLLKRLNKVMDNTSTEDLSKIMYLLVQRNVIEPVLKELGCSAKPNNRRSMSNKNSNSAKKNRRILMSQTVPSKVPVSEGKEDKES